MLSPTYLLLARHAEAANNAPGLTTAMSGWTDLPLTTRGHQQAARLAEHLARDARPHAIYSSPLLRALKTAAPIAERLRIELVTAPGLREIHCGEADGLSLREVRERFPAHWDRNEAQSDSDFRWPGGESYREFRQRVIDTIKEISLAHSGGSVLLVTHAGVVSQMMGFAAGLDEASWGQFRPRNASITELRWCNNHCQVLRFDVTPPGSS